MFNIPVCMCSNEQGFQPLPALSPVSHTNTGKPAVSMRSPLQPRNCSLERNGLHLEGESRYLPNKSTDFTSEIHKHASLTGLDISETFEIVPPRSIKQTWIGPGLFMLSMLFHAFGKGALRSGTWSLLATYGLARGIWNFVCVITPSLYCLKVLTASNPAWCQGFFKVQRQAGVSATGLASVRNAV